MNKIELDHFESLEELLITVKLWVKSEDPYDQVENRWFNTRELMEILEYTIKQKELIDKIKEISLGEIDEAYTEERKMSEKIEDILDLIKEYEEMKGNRDDNNSR